MRHPMFWGFIGGIGASWAWHAFVKPLPKPGS